MLSLCSPRPATVVLKAFASHTSDPANPVPYRRATVEEMAGTGTGLRGTFRKVKVSLQGWRGAGPSLGRETSA
jgi:hypothetical protein